LFRNREVRFRQRAASLESTSFWSGPIEYAGDPLRVNACFGDRMMALRMLGLQQLGNARYLEQWRQLSQTPDGAMVLEQIWVYLYRVVDAPHPQLKEFANTVGELAERTQMTTGQRLMDAARAEGEAKGKAEGKAAMLKRLIQLKFGALQDVDARRIDVGSAEELEAWTERILFASSLDELLSTRR
jgi:hypothetical protein